MSSASDSLLNNRAHNKGHSEGVLVQQDQARGIALFDHRNT